MRCPHCGADNSDDDKICKSCGSVLANTAPHENEYKCCNGKSDDEAENSYVPKHIPSGYGKNNLPNHSSAALVVKSVFHAIMYIVLFFSCQSFVISGYMGAIMAQQGVTYLSNELLADVVGKANDNLVLLLLISSLLSILIVCLFQRLRRREPTHEIGLYSVNFMRIPTFAFFGMALNLFVSCTLTFLPIPEWMVNAFDVHYSPVYGKTSLVLEILSIAVVGAIAEEIIFRGIVISRLLRGMGKTAAVVVSALLFGFAHGTPIAVGYAFLLGIVLGLMYTSYNSIIPCIVCHMFFNLTSYIIEEFDYIATPYIYAGAIAALILCSYRIFVRRPTLSDIFSDGGKTILPQSAEEEVFFAEVRELKENDNIIPEDIERLDEEWKRLRHLRHERKYKKTRNKNKSTRR